MKICPVSVFDSEKMHLLRKSEEKLKKVLYKSEKPVYNERVRS